MTTNTEQGRSDLLAWAASKPDDFFGSDPNLAKVLALRAGAERTAAERARLTSVGRMVAGELSRLSIDTNHDDSLPRLERYDALGVRTEQIVFHPSYHQAGKLIWNTGILADYERPGNEAIQMGMLYLVSQTGENGHNCPLACTAGLIKVLQRAGSPEQKQRFLPGLLARDYEQRIHASQFLTEVQGGSDVGANAVVARKDGAGWRIFGEKWFCSVIDGRVNDFNVRRLKRKLGTRAMASAEVDFTGALAEPVGELDRGFKNVVEHVLNTSRIFNAICCAGSMRAAFREAATFARHRRAFGQPIAVYPLVAESLATLRAEAMAALASSLRLTAEADRIALGKADAELLLAHRVGVNVNKYWTSVRNTQMVRLAMEVLGGNGAIETFSPLVRLYRDAMVLESWEGTHNVLVQQVLRDAERHGAHRAFIAELREALNRLELPHAHVGLFEHARHGLGTLERAFVLLGDGVGDQRFGRRIVDQAAVTLQLVAMLEELAATPDDAAKAAAIELIAERHLAPELTPPPPVPSALLES